MDRVAGTVNDMSDAKSEHGEAHITTNSVDASSHSHVIIGERGLHWHVRIPLVKNSLLWRELLLSLGVPLLAIAIIVLIFAKNADPVMIILLFLAIFIFFILTAFVILEHLSRLLGGGIEASCYLNASGVGYEAGEAARRIHAGTIGISILSGMVHTTGTSLAALSASENYIAWQDVKQVRIYPHPHVIYIWDKENIRPIALHCPREKFDDVIDIIRKYVPDRAIQT